MSRFVERFSDMSMNNAFRSTCSSCAAVNAVACDFSVVNFADTVLAVSVLLCSLFALISLALLGLIDLIILSVILIGIKTISHIKRNEYNK